MKLTTFAVPTLDEASPPYADQLARQQDLQNRLALAEQEQTTLRARIGASGVTATDAAKAVRVAELLDDAGGSDQLAVGLDRARLDELDRAIGDMKTALPELHKRVAAARGAASTKICEQVRPEHQRLARAICGKLVELHTAVADYTTLADDLNAHDVAWTTLTPAHPIFFGQPNDKNGPIAAYLRQAVQEGNFEAKNMPLELS